jgi:hypothetical protein
MERKISYMFQYENGTKIQSGGNSGVSICGEVNHESTKVGDVVTIVQFNLAGSYPVKAKIIGKRACDWDMSKPLYTRQSNLVIDGEMK